MIDTLTWQVNILDVLLNLIIMKLSKFGTFFKKKVGDL